MVVAKERKPTVPSRNAKAIGIPITIEKTTNPTKKMRRFVLPMSSNTGPSQYSTPTAIATKARAAPICGPVQSRSSLSSAVISIRMTPTSMAALRYPSLICNTGLKPMLRSSKCS